MKTSTIMKDAEVFWNQGAREWSRWRGNSRYLSDEKWERVGLINYGLIHLMLSSHSVWDNYSKLNIVEYGSGGGANVVELCKHFNCVYGIDIAEPSLVECKRQANLLLLYNFIPILIPIHRPEDCLNKIDKKVQVFLSAAVYHHFPSKEYGIRITDLAYKILTCPGFALIEIRYDDGTPLFKPKTENYPKNAITFNSYKSEEFADICENAGFRILTRGKVRPSNDEYFFLQK